MGQNIQGLAGLGRTLAITPGQGEPLWILGRGGAWPDSSARSRYLLSTADGVVKCGRRETGQRDPAGPGQKH